MTGVAFDLSSVAGLLTSTSNNLGDSVLLLEDDKETPSISRDDLSKFDVSSFGEM